MSRSATLASLILAAAPPAFAQEPGDDRFSFSGELRLGTAVFDRGEQLAGDALEAELGVAFDTGASGSIYGAVYTIQPIGGDADAFAEEIDYVLGYAWEGGQLAIDVSIAELTFPGSGDNSTTELAGEIAWGGDFAPTLAGFYDLDLEDAGLEFSAGPSWAVTETWKASLLGRVGFVEPGEGETRSYAGLEGALSRPLGEAAGLSVFARFEAADTDSFADEIRNGEVVGLTDSGALIGLSFTVEG